MMWVRVVIGTLVGETRAVWRWRGRVLVALGVLVALAGLAVTNWLAVQDGIHGWQTGDWERLDAAAFLPWPFLFLLFVLIFGFFVTRRTSRGLTEQFRELVASNDMRVGAPAVFQPSPLTPHEMATGAQTFQRLVAGEGWPPRRAANMWFIVATQLAVQFMMFFSNLHRALGTVDFFGIPVWSVWFFLLTFFLPMCVLLVTFVIFGVQLVRRPRMSVTADEHGLRWRGSTRAPEQQMSWEAVRSFSIVVFQDGQSPRNTFLVDGGGDAVLAWALSSRSGSDEYSEAWQLARQIVTRSGHVLRDLAPLAMSLVTTSADPARLRAIGAPESLIGGVTATKRQRRRTLFAAVPLGVGLVATLLFGLFSMGYVHYYQDRYFAGLVAKIHAGKQLYHNTLTTGGDGWLTVEPTAGGDGMSLGTVDGAYQISAPAGKIAEWTILPDFGDMAVEATVRLSGLATDYSGAGLIVHAASPSSEVVFYVNPFNGRWSLAHYVYDAAHPDTSWHNLDNGRSSAIHRGAGAENTLLALARGDMIVLYINGHFVGSYSAQDRFNENSFDAPPLIHTGSVGVYDNDGANVARFNDFTVYAIKSPPSLAYA